jgi:hypothetical protein
MENEVVPTNIQINPLEKRLRQVSVKQYSIKGRAGVPLTLKDKSTAENNIVRIQDGKRKKERAQLYYRLISTSLM